MPRSRTQTVVQSCHSGLRSTPTVRYRQRPSFRSSWTLRVSGTLTPSPTASISDYEAKLLWENAVLPAACDIPCIRLTFFVHVLSEAPPKAQCSVHSEELDSLRRGLAPRKICAPAWRTASNQRRDDRSVRWICLVGSILFGSRRTILCPHLA